MYFVQVETLTVINTAEFLKHTKIVSEYDQEIPQSQTADNPMAPRGRAAQTLLFRPPSESNLCKC